MLIFIGYQLCPLENSYKSLNPLTDECKQMRGKNGSGEREGGRVIVRRNDFDQPPLYKASRNAHEDMPITLDKRHCTKT